MSLRHWFSAVSAFDISKAPKAARAFKAAKASTVSKALAACALLAAAAPAHATSPLLANGDYPYWKLNYARYDTTYAALERQGRRYASFEWDATTYCRYRTGWQGPGAYKVGDRFRRRFGWDAGYPWQGPGVVADHEDAEALTDARAQYRRDFGHAPVCGPRHRRLRREIVLRRKG